MSETVFRIKANESYKSYIERNSERLSGLIDKACTNVNKILFIKDINIPADLIKVLENDKRVVVLTVEPSKSDLNLIENTIISALNENTLTENDFIIGAGGRAIMELTVISSSEAGIPYCLLPTTLFAMSSTYFNRESLILSGSDALVKSPEFVYSDISLLNSCPARFYFAGFTNVMKTALTFNSKYFEWLISHIYEISDKDADALDTMLTKLNTIIKTKSEAEELNDIFTEYLRAGQKLAVSINSNLDNMYLYGEAEALELISEAYISWKKDLIPMEEYYEIRDMFVPFNLPISFECSNTESMAKHFSRNNNGNMLLFNKIGQGTLGMAEKDHIKAALDELNFDEKE